jgi:hypothetical protein
VSLAFTFTVVLAAVSAKVDTGATVRAVTPAPSAVSTGATAQAADTHKFSRYQIIVDRAPFGAVSGSTAENAPQPNFAARFTFIGTAKLSETQALMAIILDKDSNNRPYFKSAGDTIGPITIARVERSPTAKLVLKQGLETATLTLETKTAPGAPSAPAAPPANQPQRGQPSSTPFQPGVRRVPFQRGG